MGCCPEGRTESDTTEATGFRFAFLLMDFPYGSAGKESTCNTGDLGLIPGLGRSGEGKGSPLQYSGLENSMDCVVMASQRVGSDCATFPSLPTHS